VSGQFHAPAALPPRKSPRYPFYRRLGGPQSRSGRYGEVKIFDPTGTRTPAPLVVQPVASRYTDWAIQASSLGTGTHPILSEVSYSLSWAVGEINNIISTITWIFQLQEQKKYI
jgi:hypothetical protein